MVAPSLWQLRLHDIARAGAKELPTSSVPPWGVGSRFTRRAGSSAGGDARSSDRQGRLLARSGWRARELRLARTTLALYAPVGLVHDPE